MFFDNVRLRNRDHLFHNINGLVNRCAQAGNIGAQLLLSKVGLSFISEDNLLDKRPLTRCYLLFMHMLTIEALPLLLSDISLANSLCGK